MSKNPYVEKFSKAFNLGLACVVFILLVVVACVPKTANAGVQGQLPVNCFSVHEFKIAYDQKTFEITSTNNISMIIDDQAVNKLKITTTRIIDRVIIQTVWIVDGPIGTGSEMYCLLYSEKVSEVL